MRLIVYLCVFCVFSYVFHTSVSLVMLKQQVG